MITVLKSCTIGFLFLLCACSLEPTDPNELVFEHAVAGSEAMVKPKLSPADVQCQNDSQCKTVEMGCCPSEETSAVNRSKIFTVSRLVNKFCGPIRIANQDLCRGKRSRMFPLKTGCVAQKCVLLK